MNSLEPLKGKVSCLQMGAFADNMVNMPERFGLTKVSPMFRSRATYRCTWWLTR